MFSHELNKFYNFYFSYYYCFIADIAVLQGEFVFGTANSYLQ